MSADNPSASSRRDGPSLAGILAKALRREDLSRGESDFAAVEILSRRATDAQAGALLTALHAKGETAEEIASFARASAVPAPKEPLSAPPIVDLCGTGGDESGTFNITTAAAFVAAGSGLAVAKLVHPAVSSRCGSAECLQALGIRWNMSAEEIRRGLAETGMAFVSVPRFLPSYARLSALRGELGIQTLLDLLPLFINPAGVTHRMVGVADPKHLDPVARVSVQLGFKRVLVLHGLGLDEATLQGETRCYEAGDDRVRAFKLDPLALGFSFAPVSKLAGAKPAVNARLTRGILMDEIRGAPRDAVVLNAAAAIWMSGKVRFLGEAVQMALSAITNGRAMAKLNALREQFPA